MSWLKNQWDKSELDMFCWSWPHFQDYKWTLNVLVSCMHDFSWTYGWIFTKLAWMTHCAKPEESRFWWPWLFQGHTCTYNVKTFSKNNTVAISLTFDRFWSNFIYIQEKNLWLTLFSWSACQFSKTEEFLESDSAGNRKQHRICWPNWACNIRACMLIPNRVYKRS